MDGSVAAFLEQRKNTTDARFAAFQARVAPADALVANFATVYATGSFGRQEASPYSDLDLFILTESDPESGPGLTPLNTIRLQAALIDAAQQAGFPPFSDEGAYLKPHLLPDMREKLGGRDDDYENLFTARMLLLLESRALLGESVHERAIDFVLDEYWKDYDDNAGAFLPAYLTNDIIRYWKVLCLNYEAKARRSDDSAKRKLDNYKLKHSRLLMCYSAIIYFCHALRDSKSISTDVARQMTRLTPIGRLNAVAEQCSPRAQEAIDELLRMYVTFLKQTCAPKAELLKRFTDDDYHRARYREAQAFGDAMFQLVNEIGASTPLFRYLVV